MKCPKGAFVICRVLYRDEYHYRIFRYTTKGHLNSCRIDGFYVLGQVNVDLLIQMYLSHYKISYKERTSFQLTKLEVEYYFKSKEEFKKKYPEELL